MRKISKYILEQFWWRNFIIFFFFFLMMQLFSPEEGWINNLKAITMLLLLYTWITFHNRILIEKYLSLKKYSIYSIALICGLFVYSLVMSLLSKEGVSIGMIIKGITISLFNTIIGVVCYHALKYVMEQQTFLKNKLYLIEIEQKYLKTQLSPHFLFNTLNNIYSYSLVASKKTPELILKLSELMRYLIEFNRKPQITLKEEIEFIENYIAFERERLEDRCKINFVQIIESLEKEIEPLLFFPLIENAFKHGTNTINNCEITIRISSTIDHLRVYIENEITQDHLHSTKTGLENVKKRLKLLYPEKHELRMEQFNGKYIAELNINLQR